MVREPKIRMSTPTPEAVVAEDAASAKWEHPHRHERALRSLLDPSTLPAYVDIAVARCRAFLAARTTCAVASSQGDSPIRLHFFGRQWPAGREALIATVLGEYVQAGMVDVNAPLAGAVFNPTEDVYGHTPFGYAAFAGKIELIEVLIDLGADASEVLPGEDLMSAIQKSPHPLATSGRMGARAASAIMHKRLREAAGQVVQATPPAGAGSRRAAL